MGFLTKQDAGFCRGCEFAGSISDSAELYFGARRVDHENVNSTLILDTEFHTSAGIVSAVNPDVAPSMADIENLLTKRCAGKCALEAEGYVPIELGEDSKKYAIEALLNSMPGIAMLGQIEFTDDGGGESESVPHVDNTGLKPIND